MLDVTFTPGPQWACLPCERSKKTFFLVCLVLFGKRLDSFVWGEVVLWLTYLYSIFNKLLIVQQSFLQLLLWWKSLGRQCISSLPSPSVQSAVALKVVYKSCLLMTEPETYGKQGVLLSRPNHWLDLGLILLKWLTQENWYRRSTSLWLDCWHFLCAECWSRPA